MPSKQELLDHIQFNIENMDEECQFIDSILRLWEDLELLIQEIPLDLNVIGKKIKNIDETDCTVETLQALQMLRLEILQVQG